jgi:hypothetical protein
MLYCRLLSLISLTMVPFCLPIFGFFTDFLLYFYFMLLLSSFIFLFFSFYLLLAVRRGSVALAPPSVSTRTSASTRTFASTAEVASTSAIRTISGARVRPPGRAAIARRRRPPPSYWSAAKISLSSLFSVLFLC